MGAVSLFCPGISGQPLVLTDSQQDWLAGRIYSNECNRQPDCLTAWNPGEAFPSFGIGHFIWYRQNQLDIYTETFPDLLNFYRGAGVALPGWIDALPGADSPWNGRDHFYAEYDGPELTELREFLARTAKVQVAFIQHRQRQTLASLLTAAPTFQQEALKSLYLAIEQTEPPYGLYALIDYINFKGEGISLTERYQGSGWGLLQVLQEMLARPTDSSLLMRFKEAADTVLTRRVQNAPPGRDEMRWLQGWKNRVATYLPPDTQ